MKPDEFDDLPPKPVATRLSTALVGVQSFAYIYDFGDYWKHLVQVEDVLPRETVYTYPICIGGANACPPEDCGWPPGFQDLKHVLAKKRDPEHKETLRWVGGYYNPKSFDANQINRDKLWTVDWRRKPNKMGLYLPRNGK